MSIFDDIKAKGASFRLEEELLYAEVLREIRSGVMRDGLWAKALSESEMNEHKAKALYIKLRTQALRDEASLLIAAISASNKITNETPKPQSKAPNKKITKKPFQVTKERKKQIISYVTISASFLSMFLAIQAIPQNLSNMLSDFIILLVMLISGLGAALATERMLDESE